MNTSLKTIALASILAFGAAACSKGDKAEPKAPPVENAQPKGEFVKPVAPENKDSVNMLLPDFAQLVAQEGGSVVNIQAHRGPSMPVAEAAPDAAQQSDDPFYELFKKLWPNGPESQEEDDDDSNFGSGVIISADGEILTNAHVVKGLNSIKVTLNDKREYTATVIGADEKSDIALLKIDADNLPAAKIGNPKELKSGEWVAAIGAPFGFDNSITAGIVSAKGRSLPYETYTPFIQTDVAINPGNSGGPLFNLNGQVVGINSQIYSRSGGFMGVSFAIPIDVAMNVAGQLKKNGKVQRGQLGVVIQEVSFDLSKAFGLDKPVGALITQVMPDSPAAKAGLREGDIIHSVNGETVRSSSDLPMAIGGLPPNTQVVLGVWRKGQQMQATAVLTTLGENNSTTANADKLPSHAGSSVGTFEVKEADLVVAVAAKGEVRELVVSQAGETAVRAGIKRGDIIREVGGVRVDSEAALREALRQAGKNVPLLLQRGNHYAFVALVLK
ncbi:DegQ family serine endoprotease [Conchiformibius kuhniae]|uniref:Probable periplasmic serine endoprotease DegP-like n=1 Tax=Conchiformibius kuhniae TaxID=211502 RepID=A0ABD8B788_9NEIS|nr:DegQ family serine endoprotease [Conchiformibius kuhniae]